MYLCLLNFELCIYVSTESDGSNVGNTRTYFGFKDSNVRKMVHLLTAA